MKVREITVEAGRTFNHPYEDYSNLRPTVRLTATVDEDEDPDTAAQVLQRQAERLVEDHKTALLDSLRQIHELERNEQKIADLERSLKLVNEDLARAREYQDRMAQRPPMLGADIGRPENEDDDIPV